MRSSRIVGRLSLLPALLLSFACGDSSTPAGPGAGGPLSARIDGAPWEASAQTTTAAGYSSVPGGLQIQGSSGAAPIRILNLTLARLIGPGEYPLGVNTITASGGVAVVSGAGRGASTPLSGAAGSVVISSLSPTRATGTFSFVAEPTDGGAPIEVTDGRFDLPISGFVAATQEERGSTTAATIEGEAWNAATVVGIASEETVTFTASNDEFTLTAIMGPLGGPGTGPLSNDTPLRRITLVGAGGSNGWGGSASDLGSITVTEISATRVRGTFSATLVAVVGSAAPVHIVNGSFDVALGP